MIGGVEVTVRTDAGSQALEVSVRAIRDDWPRSAFENGDTGERYESFSAVPFGRLKEVFVYRNPSDADAWDERGAVPELSNTMIHLILNEDSLTIVIDNMNADM